MASLRIIDGAWVYDHRLYGQRKRVTLGRADELSQQEAERKAQDILGMLEEARRREREWKGAQFSGRELAQSEEGLMVAKRAIAAISKNAKKNAARKGVPYEISAEQLQYLIAESRGRCCVSGLPFSPDNKAGSHKRPFMPSLDRIECGKGYTFENCRLVCVVVNSAMNEWGMHVLERVAMSMATHIPPIRVLR